MMMKGIPNSQPAQVARTHRRKRLRSSVPCLYICSGGIVLNEDPEASGSSLIVGAEAPSVTGRGFVANENAVPESVQAYGMSEHRRWIWWRVNDVIHKRPTRRVKPCQIADTLGYLMIGA